MTGWPREKKGSTKNGQVGISSRMVGTAKGMGIDKGTPSHLRVKGGKR